MKIAVGCDHRGFELKKFLVERLTHIGSNRIEWVDFGAHDAQRSDYPVFASAVAHAVAKRECERGILLCGTGSGMCIAANRVQGVYCAVAWNAQVARAVRQDDNVNVLSLPADYISPDQALEIVSAWLTAEFKEGRYRKRLEMTEDLAK